MRGSSRVPLAYDMALIQPNSWSIWFICLSALFCFLPLSASDDTKVIIAEGTYPVGGVST